MPKDSRLKGFLPATMFAMALRKQKRASITNSTPQSATTLFGRGNPKPELLFVGESLSEAASQLLNKMIEAMGVKVSDVFVAEVHAQAAFSEAQMIPYAPKLIVALGEAATASLLGKEQPFAKSRGRIQSWHAYSVLPTYTPEFLLKTPASKKEAWEDLKLAMKHLKWKS